MSDEVVKLIPTNPEYVPTTKCIEMIDEWIQQYNAQIIVTDEVRFIDPGANFEDITCPFCSSNIEIEWWQKEMDKASERYFHELKLITSCCNQITTLVRGQEHIYIRSRGLCGLLFLWIQLLVLFERQEVAQISEGRHKNDRSPQKQNDTYLVFTFQESIHYCAP